MTVPQVEVSDFIAGRVWATFHAVSVGAEGSDKLAAELTRYEDPRGWVVDREDAAPADHAADVLSTWAAVNAWSRTGRSIPSTVVAAAKGDLRACRGNTFQQIHLNEILVLAGHGEEARRLLSQCPLNSDGKISAAPAQETDLLSASARAWRLAVAPPGNRAATDSEMAALRRALQPAPHMQFDPWWTYYSLRGYLHAGGSPRDYEEVVIASSGYRNSDGLVRTVSPPVVTIQSTYYAIEALASLGERPERLLSVEGVRGLRSKSGEQAWGDADFALWGSAMDLMGAELSEEERGVAVTHARRCAQSALVPASARQVGVCRATLQRLGSEVPELRVRDGDWRHARGEELIVAAAADGYVPDRGRLHESTRRVLADPSEVGTILLGDVPGALEEIGIELRADERATLRREISARAGRSPFPGLVAMTRAEGMPDYVSTAAAARVIKSK